MVYLLHLASECKRFWLLLLELLFIIVNKAVAQTQDTVVQKVFIPSMSAGFKAGYNLPQ